MSAVRSYSDLCASENVVLCTLSPRTGHTRPCTHTKAPWRSVVSAVSANHPHATRTRREPLAPLPGSPGRPTTRAVVRHPRLRRTNRWGERAMHAVAANTHRETRKVLGATLSSPTRKDGYGTCCNGKRARSSLVRLQDTPRSLRRVVVRVALIEHRRRVVVFIPSFPPRALATRAALFRGGACLLPLGGDRVVKLLARDGLGVLCWVRLRRGVV